jgi:phosphoglycolate phosphatase
LGTPSREADEVRQARGVLLDLDGTLLDTAPDMARALNALRAEHALSALALAAVRPHVSHGSNAVVRAGFPDVRADEFDVLRARFLQLYRDALAVDTRLFEGFDQVLTQLEARGVPWGIVTNKPGWLTEPLMQALGLAARAGCMISGDTLPVRKPDPLPLLTGAGELGCLPAETLYLGDALRDAQAARAAQMLSLGARYGYIGESEDLSSWPVDAWIESPLQLLEWVEQPRK